MQNKKINKFIGALIILFLIVFLLIPIGMLFLMAFQNMDGNFVGVENFKEYIATPGFKVSLRNSTLVAVTATLISMVLAFIYAYGIERSNIKGKKFYNWIALLPIFAPTMTHGIALIYLFGNKGLLRGLFGEEFTIYGFWGIVISEVIYIFPVLYTVIALGLRKLDSRLYEAAEMMQTGKLRQLLTITIPGIKLSLITAFFTAFTMAFTDFGAPKIIGGNFNVLATEIYKKILGQQNLEMGAVIGIILIVPAIVVVIFNIIENKKNKYSVDSKVIAYKAKGKGFLELFFYGFNSLMVAAIIIVFSTILLSAVVTNWPYDMSLTTKWFTFNVMGISGAKIFSNSIVVSLITAIVGTILSFFAAYFYTRSKGNNLLKQILYGFSILPNVIPGLTLGIAYMLFFNKGSNPLRFIYGTFLILIIVNVIHFFSTPFLTICTELKSIDEEYENVASTMGGGYLDCLLDIIIPNSFSAIIESFSYYFVNSMMTVSAVVFLYFPHTRLAAISMINQADIGNMAVASAVAVMIIATNVIFRTLIEVIKNRRLKKKVKGVKVNA